jgi:hypothetical protein
MITYKWSIPGLSILRDAVDGKRDLVVDVSWEFVGTDEATGISAMRWGTEPVSHPVDRDMTQERVIEWLLETFRSGLVEAMKESIEAMISKQASDTRYQVTAPWRVRDEPVAGGPDVVSEEPLRLDVI